METILLFAGRLKEVFIGYLKILIVAMFSIFTLILAYGLIFVPFSKWQIQDWVLVILYLCICSLYLGGIISAFGVLGKIVVNQRSNLGPVSLRERQEIILDILKESFFWPKFFKRKLWK